MPEPTRRRSTSRRALGAAVGLAVAATGLAVAAPAQAVSPSLVISEVYGGGGNAGSTFKNDFIELYNPGPTAVSVDGWSVQYRSAAPSSATNTQVTTLSGSVAPGGYYLVQQAAGTGGTVDLPTPDATGTIAMSGTASQVWLSDGTTALKPAAGSVPTGAGIVDFVGIGSTATSFEKAPAPGTSNSISVSRTKPDADDNSLEFTTGAPTPRNKGAVEEPPPAEPTERTIREIQGTGPTTPLAGDPVITSGVVTAAYPSGGFFGFYLQTPGTGGARDLATQTVSDGLFVHQDRTAGPVTVTPGDHVEVTGVAGEYAGLTQVTVSAAADIVELTEPAAAPTPGTTVAWPATDAQKESLEGMLYAPGTGFTVTNTFATNQFGEVGLALGDRPLIQPTEVADAGSAEATAVASDNAARAITLDDGASTNFTAQSFTASVCGTRPTPCLLNGDQTPPYVSTTEPVRVGAPTTITAPVILSQGGSPSAPTYRFQPTATVVGPDNATSPATFADTRTAAPDAALIDAEGASDIQVASFNVLNYFTTLGDADDDNVGDAGCAAFNDRTGDGNTVSGGCDQRGAWDPQDLARQQQKIVAAINALDADVVGLMEIENSAALVETPDEATNTLVAALNAAAGSQVWAANPSSSELPAPAEQDVITNAIIYRTAAVTRLGEARALGTLSADGQAFGNAREPIAQAFTPVGGGEDFMVVVNHFKSKGSGVDDMTGQGNANPDRVAQATALAAWVPTVQDETGTESVLLVGDFNAYTQEDPMQVLYDAGYDDSELLSGNDEYSYSFSGLSGSLDHVLLNTAAQASFTGSDIWNINSGESVALEYSRFDVHATDFYVPGPYRSSDHDPVVVGLDLVDEPVLLPATVSVKQTPPKVKVDKTRTKLTITVEAEGVRPVGTITITGVEGDPVTVQLEGGTATVRLPEFTTTGDKELSITYSGDDEVEQTTTTHVVRVVR
ncbi:ExeM/NucH family extracellular endonuclease [Nocardioides sp.]|uniref:ExeM/NucH family extracellular endonuclease n=1 Tax=Nocardioides sp. TaxID=35761 RepID=UPI00286AD81E|nr:ExeM/NucH family extracellular endonuclease [Nocardioides sp.]